jgi:hypothetical protein
MNLRPLTWLAPLLLTAVALAAPTIVRELRVRPDKNQVVASRLAGAWEPDPALGERLGTKARMERLEFTPDESVLATIPAELAEKIAAERIYQAGTLRFVEKGEEKRMPYLLLVHGGNSSVVYFLSRNGQGLDDGESMLLTVVPARDTAADLLFAGGDFNNEPFTAYHRVAK